jgi:hypothetical protein
MARHGTHTHTGRVSDKSPRQPLCWQKTSCIKADGTSSRHIMLQHLLRQQAMRTGCCGPSALCGTLCAIVVADAPQPGLASSTQGQAVIYIMHSRYNGYLRTEEPKEQRQLGTDRFHATWCLSRQSAKLHSVQVQARSATRAQVVAVPTQQATPDRRSWLTCAGTRYSRS